MKAIAFHTGQTFGASPADEQPFSPVVLDAMRRCPGAEVWRDTGAITVPRSDEKWFRDMLFAHGIEIV